MQKRTDALTCSPRFLRLSPALLLVVVGASSHAGSNAVRDADASRISVTAVAGAVEFTMAGNAAAVAPNTTVLLPARIITGSDGNVGLTQAGTNVSVASDTDVEIPAEAVDGNLIARMIQRRGNVFYDVAPRDLGKLRVETPLLVAVIKGTQFNVAVQPDSTTISLFEGRLEIRTPDNSDVVLLNAGEIAIRSLIDDDIRVVGMNDARAPAPGAARDAVAVAAARTAPSDTILASPTAMASDGLVARIDTRDASIVSKPAIEVAGVEASATTVVAVDGGALDAALETRVDIGSANVDIGLGTAVDLAAAAVDVGLSTGVDLGTGSVDVGVDTGVDLGASAVNLGLDTSLDLGGADIIDSTVDAGVDLGGALDVGVAADIDLGGVVDTSLDAGVTIDPGTLDLGLDASLDLGAALDVGLDLDLGDGTLDLGLGAITTETAPAPEPAPPPRGLLGGLLGLP
ncbi:MAG TPA: FecR domain-containing protein [Gammaproteobacteria bacterium]|nr:FecR domain-containing protein [Gammaproteobacteria bacterium]